MVGGLGSCVDVLVGFGMKSGIRADSIETESEMQINKIVEP